MGCRLFDGLQAVAAAVLRSFTLFPGMQMTNKQLNATSVPVHTHFHSEEHQRQNCQPTPRWRQLMWYTCRSARPARREHQGIYWASDRLSLPIPQHPRGAVRCGVLITPADVSYAIICLRPSLLKASEIEKKWKKAKDSPYLQGVYFAICTFQFL